MTGRPKKKIADGLHAKSARYLAAESGCSVRTIRRRRREARDRTDPASKAQSDAIHERIRAAQARYANTRRLAAANRLRQITPTAGWQPLQQPLSKVDADTIETYRGLVGMLPLAFEFIRLGGSRTLYEWCPIADLNRPTHNLIDTLLPPKGRLSPWIYPLASTRTDDRILGDLSKITSHPTTIAWAVHAPDRTKSCLHLHVLSDMSGGSLSELSLNALRCRVGASGRPQTIYASAAKLLEYMDGRDRRKMSLTGLNFGQAATPEVRCLAAHAALVNRSILDGRLRDAHAALDLAQVLVDRARNMARPVVPPKWTDLMANLIYAAYVGTGLSEAEHAYVASLGYRISVLWGSLQSRTERLPPRGLPWLAIPDYYCRLIDLTEEGTVGQDDLEGLRRRYLLQMPDAIEDYAIGARGATDAALYDRFRHNERFQTGSLTWAAARYLTAPRDLRTALTSVDPYVAPFSPVELIKALFAKESS